jgi:putative SOS response-associated peptidase YedK
MKTINCRDDSLYEDRGMWTSMKKKKRCVVIAQGFYEWLKKDGSKEKTPHFTKHKDGRLMCFAGLYDCVQLEGMLVFVLDACSVQSVCCVATICCHCAGHGTG